MAVGVVSIVDDHDTSLTRTPVTVIFGGRVSDPSSPAPNPAEVPSIGDLRTAIRRADAIPAKAGLYERLHSA
jgi:hypothetical protein